MPILSLTKILALQCHNAVFLQKVDDVRSLPTPYDIDCKESKFTTVFIYSCEYLTFSLRWAKTSQNLEQARKTELNVAGRKNAALFEWAAFVKAEKEELALRVDLFVEYWLQCRIEAGLFLMRFLIMYTLMYTVFSGALARSHCLHPHDRGV